MKKVYMIFGMLGIIYLAGCKSTGHLTRRYKTVEYIKQDVNQMDQLVSATVFINDKDKDVPPKPRVILDALSPQGQKAYLNSLSSRETTTDKFLTASTSTFDHKEKDIEVFDYTKIEKRVNLSVENISHVFGNRIVKLKAKLKFDGTIRIVGCDRLVTQYQTVELGKLNYANTSGFEAAASAGIGYSGTIGNTGENSWKVTSNTEGTHDDLTSNRGNESAWTNGISNALTSTGNIGASAKYTGSKSFAEEVLLRQRIVALTASINDNTLVLYQESINGIDLTGTTFADIILSSDNIAVAKVFSFSDLIQKDSTSTIPTKVKIKESRIMYHNIKDDINVEFSYDVDYRSVVKGDKTISESDDRIKLYYGNCSHTSITLLKKEQIRPKMWVLTSSIGKFLPVTINGALISSGELIFSSFSDISNFHT